MEQEPQARVEEKTQEFSSAARYHFFRKILISTLQYINCFFYIHIKNNLLQIKSAQDPYLHWKYRFIQNCAQKVVFQNQNFTPQNFDLRRVSVFSKIIFQNLNFHSLTLLSLDMLHELIHIQIASNKSKSTFKTKTPN